MNINTYRMTLGITIFAMASFVTIMLWGWLGFDIVLLYIMGTALIWRGAKQ